MHQKLVGFLAPIGDKRKAKHPPADEQVGCAGVNVYPVFALSIHHGGVGGGATQVAWRQLKHPSIEHFGLQHQLCLPFQ